MELEVTPGAVGGTATGQDLKANSEPDCNPKPERAKQCLRELLGDGKPVTFQTFDDDKDRDAPGLRRVFHGQTDKIPDQLIELNRNGAAVCFLPNEHAAVYDDKTGRAIRGNEHVTDVRALYVDKDTIGDPDELLHALLPPHLLVASSPGKWHAYWRVTGVPLDRFTELQKRLIAQFKTDPQVHELCRVMRLPGFFHRKGQPFLVDYYRREDML